MILLYALGLKRNAYLSSVYCLYKGTNSSQSLLYKAFMAIAEMPTTNNEVRGRVYTHPSFITIILITRMDSMGLEAATKVFRDAYAFRSICGSSIVHTRSRYQLRHRRGRICRLCPWCLNVWPGCSASQAIPVPNVNNDCVTGSTSLFQAAILVRAGEARCARSRV